MKAQGYVFVNKGLSPEGWGFIVQIDEGFAEYRAYKFKRMKDAIAEGNRVAKKLGWEITGWERVD